MEKSRYTRPGFKRDHVAKGERVKISAPLELMERDAWTYDNPERYYLHMGEIFEHTDYPQPVYMDYLNVYCHKRKKTFVLPMEFVLPMD